MDFRSCWIFLKLVISGILVVGTEWRAKIWRILPPSQSFVYFFSDDLAVAQLVRQVIPLVASSQLQTGSSARATTLCKDKVGVGGSVRTLCVNGVMAKVAHYCGFPDLQVKF
ncbi:hypothetical protein FIBSPDRAFT_1046727 [Athelia psychrophila]|uniref:Uncharacterized protein n=1 Tax=Athelia psychrophila TaxID=1759441 RepID=A0A166G7P3_9AGAM|nr:hypothetical protein FIBSPDRAFT_1046727 [Fibularhizoctonia sp. CBS 109695]